MEEVRATLDTGISPTLSTGSHDASSILHLQFVGDVALRILRLEKMAELSNALCTRIVNVHTLIFAIGRFWPSTSTKAMTACDVCFVSFVSFQHSLQASLKTSRAANLPILKPLGGGGGGGR